MIYKITNMLNDKIYIGGTVKTKLHERFNEHFAHAFKYKSQTDKMKDMRNISKKYWKIEKIEDCEDEFIKERETFYIKKFLKEGFNLYNTNYISNAKKPFYSYDLITKEVKKYNSYKETGYNISKLSVILNKTKELHNGKEYQRKSYKNKLWSFKNSKEEWEKLKKENDNKKAKPRKVINLDTGIVYESIADANEDLGKPRKHNSITNALKGRTEKGLGYKWKYLN